MLFEPTLIVERMVIEKDDHVAYDERFHMGVNVIRGDNSSGKSTVLNFIFYGLGGATFKIGAKQLCAVRAFTCRSV